MTNVALIVAGGTGNRMNASAPKQFLKIGAKTILEHSIEAFRKNKNISAVKVVIHADWEAEYLLIAEKYNILPHSYGGANRQESVLNGLRDLTDFNPKNVLIHDAARPLVSDRIINESVAALDDYQAVDVLMPVSDTIKNIQNEVVNRDELLITQTPQSFNFETILKLHEQYKGEQFTDDIALAIKAKIPAGRVTGDRANFKITNQDDLEMAEMMTKKSVRVGYGYDIHEFDYSGNKTSLPICGINIDCGYGVIAHSDGDVGLHALVDAILGACARGDIGELFPPSDTKWKDTDSSMFIAKCVEILSGLNAEINNIDITIVCEQPKISKYKQAMRQNIAKLLSISQELVNIKATTSEKMGFIGRKEGLSATAVCTLTI